MSHGTLDPRDKPIPRACFPLPNAFISTVHPRNASASTGPQTQRSSLSPGRLLKTYPGSNRNRHSAHSGHFSPPTAAIAATRDPIANPASVHCPCARSVRDWKYLGNYRCVQFHKLIMVRSMIRRWPHSWFPPDPLMEYQRLVATEKIRYDEQQMRAVIQVCSGRTNSVYTLLSGNMHSIPPPPILNNSLGIFTTNCSTTSRLRISSSSSSGWTWPWKRHLSRLVDGAPTTSCNCIFPC